MKNLIILIVLILSFSCGKTDKKKSSVNPYTYDSCNWQMLQSWHCAWDKCILVFNGKYYTVFYGGYWIAGKSYRVCANGSVYTSVLRDSEVFDIEEIATKQQ